MKYSNLFAGLLLAISFALVGSVACTHPGDVKDPRSQQENIAAACKGITVAANAVAAAAEQGQVSKADARKALAVAAPTRSFCEPKPAQALTAADYALLLNAAADLATQKKAISP